jgi:hypothetical protein
MALTILQDRNSLDEVFPNLKRLRISDLGQERPLDIMNKDLFVTSSSICASIDLSVLVQVPVGLHIDISFLTKGALPINIYSLSSTCMMRERFKPCVEQWTHSQSLRKVKITTPRNLIASQVSK